MPTICSPFPPYFFCRLTKLGISSMHGSHHVAQKFSKTTFPFSSERRNVAPSVVVSSKSGAAFPSNTASGFLVDCGAAPLPQQKDPTAKVTAANIVHFMGVLACKILRQRPSVHGSAR